MPLDLRLVIVAVLLFAWPARSIFSQTALPPSQQRKPANREVAGATNAAEDQAKTGSPSQWTTRPVTAPHVEFQTFNSPAAKARVSYHIYQPEIYATNKEQRFPVLYWLHGTGGGLGGIAPLSAFFNDAIRAGKLPPLLIVFPNGMASSMWCDSKDGVTPMETVVVKELVPHIDANFRTIGIREGRLIEGFSMGGYGAARLGFKYPEVFGAVSILAGGPLDLDFQGPRAVTNPAERERILKETFGGEIAYYREQSPITLAEKNAQAIRGRMIIRQAVGNRDSTGPLNRAFSMHLDKLGIKHTFTLAPGVGHETLALLNGLEEANWEFYRRAFGGLTSKESHTLRTGDADKTMSAAQVSATTQMRSGSPAELTPAELELRRQLGPDTPDPIPLWPDKPPRFAENAPPETVIENAKIRAVTVPTITPYLPPAEKRNGMAIIICAGGGYGSLDWQTHVVYAAQVFNRKGVAVIGLKYRLRPPNGASNGEIQAITLLDAKRAVRFVRHHAGDWNLEPHRIGIAGYSAGANLAMNLAANFDCGDASTTDAIERQSSRPDFAVGCATWHWRKKESPFHFPKDAPPIFLVHATDDGINGGAPIEMPRSIKADLEKLGVPVRMIEFAEGAHGVGNLIPQRVQNGFPPARWPEMLLSWLEEISRR